MERKKLIRVALIILITIIALIIVEVSIRGIHTGIKSYKEYIEKREDEEAILETTEYKEEKYLENVVATVGKMLNEKDTDALYELTNEEYRDYKFQNNKEEFSKFISNYFTSGEAKYEFQSYENEYGRYVCRMLAFYNGTYNSYKLLVKPKEDEKYDIILDEIDALSKSKENLRMDGNLQYSLKYTGIKQGYFFYVIEFENTSKNNLEYVYDSVVLRNSYGNSYNSNATGSKLNLVPGVKTRCEFLFYGKNIGLYDHTKLEMNLKDSNGNSREITVYLENS